jgi:hypothetical protein
MDSFTSAILLPVLSSDWFSDTDPKALDVFLDLQRKMSPSEKLQRVFQANAMMRALAEADVRRLYPDADEREVFLRAAARRLGPELMMKVYGWTERA